MKFLKRLIDPSVFCSIFGIALLVAALIGALLSDDYQEAPYYFRAVTLCLVGLDLSIIALLIRVGDILNGILIACKSGVVDDVNTPGSQV